MLQRVRDDGVDGAHLTASKCQSGCACEHTTEEWEPSAMEVSMIGLDIAKLSFQVHGVGADGSVAVRRRLRRGGSAGRHAECQADDGAAGE